MKTEPPTRNLLVYNAIEDWICSELEQFLFSKYTMLPSNILKDVVSLDSSTPEKFSRHLIFPLIMFKSTVECGRLVSEFKTTIQKKVTEVIKNGNSLIDTAVYNKNQVFRLFLSTKRGQKRPLTLSGRSSYNGTTDYEILCRSFVGGNFDDKAICLLGRKSNKPFFACAGGRDGSILSVLHENHLPSHPSTEQHPND